MSEILDYLASFGPPAANIALSTASLAGCYTQDYHSGYQSGCEQAKIDVSSGIHAQAGLGSYSLIVPILEGLSVGTVSNLMLYFAGRGLVQTSSLKNKLIYALLALMSMGVNITEVLAAWHSNSNMYGLQDNQTSWHTNGYADGYWQSYATCWQSYNNESTNPYANDHTNTSMGNLFELVPGPGKVIIGAALSCFVFGKGMSDG